MRLRVSHGIRGETALAMDVLDRITLGWDIIKQTAKVLKLGSPFQVVLYAASSSVIQPPLRAVQFDTDANEATFCYIVQSLQAPSAQQYRDLLAAICHKDVIDVSYQLGKGVGLMAMATEEGHVSTLVASAILRDHSADPYAFQIAAGHCFPRHGATLTYLLLQAHADPNIIPPKTKPTTMLELAVELGSSQHVQILLEAGASVMPVKGALPPFFLLSFIDTGLMYSCSLTRKRTRGKRFRLLPCFAIHWNGMVTLPEKKSSTLYKLLLRKVLKTQSLICYSNGVAPQTRTEVSKPF